MKILFNLLRCFTRLAAGLGLLLAGCATAAVTPQPQELVVAAPKGEVASALEAAADVYAKSGGEKVRVAALGSESYAAQVEPALLGGLGRYDLVYLSAGDLPRWAGYHAIQPLTGPFETAAAPWLEAATFAGQVYGSPTQPDPVVLWYRADLLQAAGLSAPEDWEALHNAALALNAPPERYGAALAAGELDGGLSFAALLAATGGQAISGTPASGYQVEADSPAARRALDTYASLAKAAPPGAADFTFFDVAAALQSGRAALGIAPLSSGAELLDCAASPKVCPAGKPLLSWSWLPGSGSQRLVGSLGVWAIPQGAKSPAQAQRFAAWLAGEAGARAWAQAGGIPAHTGVLSQAEAIVAAGKAQQVAAAQQEPSGEAQPSPNPLLNSRLAQGGSFYLAFPPITTSDLLLQASSAAVQSVLRGEQTTGQALDEAAEKMRQALRQGGVLSSR